MRLLALVVLAACWTSQTKIVAIPPMVIRSARPATLPREGCDVSIQDLAKLVDPGPMDPPLMNDTYCDDETDLELYWWCNNNVRAEALTRFAEVAYWAVYYCTRNQ